MTRYDEKANDMWGSAKEARMKPEDFEKHLQRQPLRQVPAEWRQGVLSAARQAARPEPVPRDAHDGLWAVLSTIYSRLSTLLWPHPAAWAGLAAVWVVILGLSFTSRDAARDVARGTSSLSPQVFMAFQEQQRLLSELIGPREMPAVERPKAAPPRPRSERRNGLMMA
jgi:hypothetical protein